MAQGLRDAVSAWEEIHVEVDECRELDDERVLVLFRRGGRGRISEVELGQMQTKGRTYFRSAAAR